MDTLESEYAAINQAMQEAADLVVTASAAKLDEVIPGWHNSEYLLLADLNVDQCEKCMVPFLTGFPYNHWDTQVELATILLPDFRRTAGGLAEAMIQLGFAGNGYVYRTEHLTNSWRKEIGQRRNI